MDWKKGGVILSLSLVFLLIGVLSANAEYCGDTYNEAVYNGPLEVGCNVDSLCEWNAGTQICVSKSQPSVPVQPIVAPADSAGSNSNDAYCQSLVQSVSDSSIAQGMCNNNPKCTWKNFKCVGKETQSQLPTERSTPVQVKEEEQPEPEKTSQPVIIPPSNLKASLSNNNVILTWKPATVTTTSGTGRLAGAVVLENQITGNAGFFDSIANFFRNLFGIGTRGTLTQQNLVYDVWRKEAGGNYEAITRGLNCPVTSGTCTYTDAPAQQGKDYTYKVGARLSTTSSPSDDSVKFSNKASINIPAAGQPTYEDLDFDKDGRVDITVSGSDLLGSDGTLFTQHFGTITSSSNWDAAYDLNADEKVDSEDFLILADLLASACSTINVDLCPTGRCEVVGGACIVKSDARVVEERPITITASSDTVEVGQSVTLTAASQTVTKFRWGLLNYNPSNPICTIVHHGTEDGGPYVNFGAPIRGKSP